MLLNPNRGEIWLVNLNPTVGHEQNKIRPCIVISTDSYNHGRAGMITVVPLTSKNKQIAWHVPLSAQESGLDVTSYIICDQLRSISKLRLIKKTPGKISQDTWDTVEEYIKTLLAFK